MPLLSIAIPTYNRREYLGDCLKSLLRQFFTDYLIYVFDNASDYDIENYIKEFNSDKIVLVRSDINLGNLANFQRIFNFKFDSPYVMAFHDDDTLHPDYLEKAVASLERNKDLVWVSSGLKFVKDDGKMFDFTEADGVHCDILDTTSLINILLNDFDICFDSVVYRNILPIDIKKFQENFGKWADRPMLIELSKKGKVGVFAFPFVNYRIHLSQDSQIIKDYDSLVFLKNLYVFYRDNLAPNIGDKRIFLKWSTNFLLQDLSGCAKNLVDYFKLLNIFKKEGYINFLSLRPRGIYYFLTAVKRYVVSYIN